MTGKDLAIRGKENKHVPMRREYEYPFFALQHGVDRLMDESLGMDSTCSA